MKKILVISIALVALAGVFTAVQYNKPTPMETIVVETTNIGDFKDKRQLVGAAQNVFIGKVIKKSGDKRLSELPETQFQIEVLDNIKGHLKGTITVNQQGGKKEDQLHLVEGDRLLTPGETYLFATRYLKEEDWHTLIPNYGDVQITSEDQKGKLVKEFRKAQKEEIAPDIGTRGNNDVESDVNEEEIKKYNEQVKPEKEPDEGKQ
ncbi:hypothetical protein [Bacillus rhizoplanae]|uniref:hypothetical protein n=1 Tax=Bacillus rhizoplanae TaxID=2880966 RepID=UPI003D19A455